jgi:hypothetical protein
MYIHTQSTADELNVCTVQATSLATPSASLMGLMGLVNTPRPAVAPAAPVRYMRSTPGNANANTNAPPFSPYGRGLLMDHHEGAADPSCPSFTCTCGGANFVTMVEQGKDTCHACPDPCDPTMDPCKTRSNTRNRCVRREDTANCAQHVCVCDGHGWTADPLAKACVTCADGCHDDPCLSKQDKLNTCSSDVATARDGCGLPTCACLGSLSVASADQRSCEPCADPCAAGMGDPCLTRRDARNVCSARKSSPGSCPMHVCSCGAPNFRDSITIVRNGPQGLLLHSCYTAVALLLHCFYTLATLLFHSSSTVVTLLLH